MLAVKVTPGNVDDGKGLLTIASGLFGTMYADKGYIGKEFVQKMKNKGIDLVTRVRKNMKEVMHSEFDQALLRKRSLVETVFDELKNLCHIEHTRHRGVLPATREASHCNMGFSGPLGRELTPCVTQKSGYLSTLLAPWPTFRCISSCCNPAISPRRTRSMAPT